MILYGTLALLSFAVACLGLWAAVTSIPHGAWFSVAFNTFSSGLNFWVCERNIGYVADAYRKRKGQT